jgi:hypothetical protein
MKELRVLAELWRVHYNTVRPHSSLGYRLPAPEAWLTNNMGSGEERRGMIGASSAHNSAKISANFCNLTRTDQSAIAD